MKSRGFTLAEVLVVIAILVIVAGMTAYFFGSWSKKEALEKDAASLAALLNQARMLSVASKDASAFGVHLENGRAVLFEGISYVPGGPGEKVFDFSNNVYLYGASLNGGGSDILFGRLTGSTSEFGSVSLSLKDDSASTTITILQTGVIQ